MVRPRRFAGLCWLLVGSWCLACGNTPPLDELPVPRHVATVPAANERQAQRTARLLERAAGAGTARLVFLGDSITQGWEAAGAEAWRIHYAKLGALNLGVSGDRTENVLARIDRGQLDGLSPRVLVLMIGTNNASAGHRPEEIADGVTAILQRIRQRLPTTCVLLLAIFPRGPGALDPLRIVNDDVNARLAGLADGETVVFLDIAETFLDDQGRTQRPIMPDGLHLSPRGYALWAGAMEETLGELLER